MALKVREELVGKRFLSLLKGEGADRCAVAPPRSLPPSEWDWRSGVIRASASQLSQQNQNDVRVLVEYDDMDWQLRQWITIKEVFQVFLVEETVAWVPCHVNGHSTSVKKLYPALTFRPLLDKSGVTDDETPSRPVEFLVDRRLEFVSRSTSLQMLKETDLKADPPICDDPMALECVRQWMEFQDGQQILLKTPSVLVGYRVQVYRSEGTTQWYTAVIKSYNENNQTLDVTDDTVLEEHQVNPTLVQMNLLGDGVISSILRGEDSGIRPSRTRRCSRVRYNSASSGPAVTLDLPSKANNKLQSYLKYGPALPRTGKCVGGGKVVVIKEDINNRVSKSDQAVVCGKEKPLDSSTPPSLPGSPVSPKKSKASGINSRKGDGSLSPRKKLKKHKSDLSLDETLFSESCKTFVANDLDSTGKSLALDSTSPSKLTSPSSSASSNSESEPVSIYKSQIVHSNSIRINISKSPSKTAAQETGKATRYERKDGAALTKETYPQEPTDVSSLPELNDRMPKLKGAAMSTEHHNSAEAQGAGERLEFLKSGVSINSAMALAQQLKTVANHSPSVPSGCLNLTAKVPEVRKHLLPGVKAAESGELNFSGLNLNQSVTDQIAQRSREKLNRSAAVKMAPNREPSSILNSAAEMKSESPSAREFLELNKRDSPNLGIGLGTTANQTTSSSSLLQQRNSKLSNSLGRHSDSSLKFANSKNYKTSTTNVHPANEIPSRSVGAETKAPSTQSNVSTLTLASTVETVARQNLALNAFPCRLPLLNQVTAAAVHQLSRATPSTVNQQPIPMNSFFLLPTEQRHLMEKLMQMPAASSGSGAILAACPPYLANIISMRPELLWLQYKEIQLEALRQQQLSNQATEADNGESKSVEINNSKVVSDSSLACTENVKKEIPLANSAQPKKNADRAKEPLKEPGVEHAKDPSSVVNQKRSELLYSGSISDAVNQHFTESLRNVQQKDGLQPPGRDHRLFLAQPDHLSASVNQDSHPKQTALQPAGLAVGSAEHPFLKENRMQTIDSIVSSSSAPGLLNKTRSSTVHLVPDKPAAQTLSTTAAAAILSTAASLSSSASLISSSSSNLMKKEPSLNLYGYQSCPVYLTPNAVHMQSFNSDKKAAKKELENRKNVQERAHISSNDVGQLLSTQTVPVDGSRSKTATEKNCSGGGGDSSRSMVLTGGHHQTQSPKPQKLERHDAVNATAGNHSNHPSTLSACTLEERRLEGALNCVVAAAAVKGSILVSPIHPNGQSKVNMPILKESLTAKPKPLAAGVAGPMLGGLVGLEVAGRVGQMTTAVHPMSSVVTAPERTLNGLLSSLPISSAAAGVSGYSISLPSNSLSLAMASGSAGTPGTTTSALAASSSYSSLGSWPQNPLKRNFTMATEAKDHLSNDSFPDDSVKRIRGNCAEGLPRNQSPAVGAVICSVQGALSSASTTCSTYISTSSKMMRTCNEYLRTYAEAKDYSGKTLASVAGNHLLASAECDRGSVIVGHKAFEEPPVQVQRISHYNADAQEDNCQVQDLKLTSSVPTISSASARLHDYLGQPLNSETNQGADSDTLSANSPAAPLSSLSSSSAATIPANPVCAEPATQKQWQHTKFKKALLQRYSDEDLKNTPEGTQDGDNGRKTENGNETLSSSTLLEERDDNNSLVGINNDTMSAASEQESSGWISATDSVNSNRVKKKRKSSRHLAKSDPPDKMRKLSDTEESTTSSSGTSMMVRDKNSKRHRHNKEEEGEDQEKEHGRTVAAEGQMTQKISNNLSLMNASSSTSSSSSSSSSASSQQHLPDCQSKILKRQEELKTSSCRDDPSVSLAKKKLNSSSEEQRQRTMEVFLQDDDCHKVTPKLVKCRECKMVRNKRDKRVASDFCRFYAFRRLRYSPKRFLTVAGFSEPCDADALDIELWMPMMPVMAPAVDVETAMYIIMHTGDRFASLVKQEQEAKSWVSLDSKIAWKQAVQGVREMCDVCDATLFNMHWVCHKCGFAVCIDCFRIRWHKANHCADAKSPPCENHGRKWLTCSVNRQMHEPDHLMMVQIIPSDVLWVVGKMLDEIRKQFQIHSKVKVGDVVPKKETLPDGLKDAAASRDLSTAGKCNESQQPLPAFFDLSMLAEAALAQKPEQNLSTANGVSSELNGSADNKCSTLKDLLTKTISVLPSAAGDDVRRPPGSSPKNSLEDIIHKVMKRTAAIPTPKTVTLSYYVPRVGSTVAGRTSPIPEYSHEQTSSLFPDVLHAWQDHGRLLQLFDPQSLGNIRLFQQQWRHGQPVLVSNCDAGLERSLWKPETFSKEFGHVENLLVNCIDGAELSGQRMKKFWDGFERMSGRLKDKDGRPIVLKLKDWPQKDEFAELLPNHYQDLMSSLPLPEYTKKGGPFNLVSRLPEFFMKPDLGPKLYCAYGQTKCPEAGTTNLHQDITDAFNLLVYVGLPKDNLENQKSAVSAVLESSGCCQLTRERLKEPGTKPGALWHVFDPLDADKIRDLLNKVASERGEEVELHHDPLHTQNWYLDEKLRGRLLSDYGVQCYTIVQCLGDAVFIPAGAPHQVLNLNSCIKVAADFVSPESIDNCFQMTQECRQLSSDAHGSCVHEDKLQVKNIIYHAVKDAIAVLRDAAPKYEG